MRKLLVSLLAASIAAATASATASPRQVSTERALPFGATLTAQTHRPKANTKWYYTVRVAGLGGKPIKARITVQIRDPLGNLHPVLYANTKRKLIDWPIDGHFRDYITWPRSSAVGISLTLRVTVKVGARRKVLTFPVTPRA